MPIDPELFAIMACPRCHGQLRLEAAPESIVCPNCRLRFSIEEGIPNMLLDEATPWDGPAGR